MGLGRRTSALALVVTLSVMGTALPAHAAEESPPLTLNGRPLSQFPDARAAGGPTRLSVLLDQESGQISGVLLGEDRPPLSEQPVELDSSEGSLRLVATTNANGVFSYTGLGPGRYEVLYRVDGDVRARSGPLDLGAGAMQVDNVTPTLGGQGEVARSFQDLSTRVEPGAELFVIDASGNEMIGDLLEISDSSLGLRVGQNRLDLAESNVVRIEGPPDPVWNGIAIGAGIAAGAALGIVGAACAGGVWGRHRSRGGRLRGQVVDARSRYRSDRLAQSFPPVALPLACKHSLKRYGVLGASAW